MQAVNQRVALEHSPHRQSQRNCHRCGQPLRDRRNRNRNARHQHIKHRLALDNPSRRHNHANHNANQRQHFAKLRQLFLQRCQFVRHLANHVGNLAHLRPHTGQHCLTTRHALYADRSHVYHMRQIRHTVIQLAGTRLFLRRHALPRENGLIAQHPLVAHNKSVTGNPVPCLQFKNIPHHKFRRGNFPQNTVAINLRRGCGHFLQGFQRPLRAKFL